MHLNERNVEDVLETLGDTDYVEICAALAVFSKQLRRASLTTL